MCLALAGVGIFSVLYSSQNSFSLHWLKRPPVCVEQHATRSIPAVSQHHALKREAKPILGAALLGSAGSVLVRHLPYRALRILWVCLVVDMFSGTRASLDVSLLVK